MNNHYTVFCIALLTLISVLICSGCSSAIEKYRYESTREVGTRNRDAGSFNVTRISPNTFRIGYTQRIHGFDRKEGIDAEQTELKLKMEAARITIENGFTHFVRYGKGRSAREGIIMSRMLIRCYSVQDEEIPESAIDAKNY